MHANPMMMNTIQANSQAALLNSLHNAGPLRRDGLEFVPVEALGRMTHAPFIGDVLYDPANYPFVGVHPLLPNVRHFR